MASPERKRSCAQDPDFLAMLRLARLKATGPRLAIIDFLFHEHGPFTPEQIYQNVADQGLDLTTVYRSTSALAKAGVLTRCEFGDGLARYEFHATEEMSSHHHHVICRECKTVTPVEFCLSGTWKTVLSKMGFSDPGHSLEFFGTCRNCQADSGRL